MTHVLLVGIGGLVGSVLRFLVSGLVQNMTETIFPYGTLAVNPYGTLAVNLIGCFVIGILAQLVDVGALSPEARPFAIIGFLGGFTTYSSFGNETLNLWRDAETFLGFANIALHLVLGLGAVWLGRMLAYKIWG